MKNIILKDTVKEIKNTFKRFLSILLVVLLGVGFFAGIKAASPDMKDTIDTYFDDRNVMDIQILSTLGLTVKDINTLKNVDGVENAIGTYAQDVIISADDKEAVIKMETMSNQINELTLIEGKLPEKMEECVVEEGLLSWANHKIGDTIEIKAEKVKDDEGNEKELLKQNKMRIVGVVRSALYTSRERGNSKLGSGKVEYYISIQMQLHKIYTQMHIYK